jgi:hypothetical protein
MTDLISNGERLRSVRAKLNAALRPYASRAEFEKAVVPDAVTLVNVIVGADIYQCVRDIAGDWVDGGGKRWRAAVINSISAQFFEETRDEAVAAGNAAASAQAVSEAARDQAVSARDAAFVSLNIYASTAAGLAATVVGDQFQVVSGEEVIRYRHDAGPVATELVRFPRADHGHPAAKISDSTAAGRALLTAADLDAQRDTLGIGDVEFAAISGGDDGVAFTDLDGFLFGSLGRTSAEIAGCEIRQMEGLPTATLVGNDLFVIEQAASAAPDLRPYFGTNLYGVAGVDLPIYLSGLIANREDVWRGRMVLAGDAVADGMRRLSIAADLLGSTARLQIRPIEGRGAPHMELPLSVYAAPQSPASGGSPVILSVGDSITQRAGTAWAAYFLSQWGYAPNFVGTLLSEADGPATGKLGEGKPGHTLQDLAYLATNRVAPLPEGDEALYAAMDTTNKRLWNTMLRAANEADPEDDVRNGYVLDFQFYVARHGLTTPTILWHGYGTNDIRDIGPGSIENHIYDLDSLVYRRWHSDYPTAPVVRWLPGTAVEFERNEVWLRSYIPAIRGMLRAASEAAGPVLLVPTWAMHSPEAGFDLTAPTETPDPVTGHIVRQIGDTIHPTGGSRRELFRALAAAIACAATSNY